MYDSENWKEQGLNWSHDKNGCILPKGHRYARPIGTILSPWGPRVVLVVQKLSQTVPRLSPSFPKFFQSFVKVVPNMSRFQTFFQLFLRTLCCQVDLWRCVWNHKVTGDGRVNSSCGGPTSKVESLFGLRCWQEVRASLKEKVAWSSNRWDSNASPRWR